MKKETKIILIALPFLLIVLVYFWWMTPAKVVYLGQWICQDGQWIKQGNPTSSQPTTVCVATTTPSNDNYDDLIRVIFPQPNQTVNSPIEITGQARGSWFFEAVFPARLYDSQGKFLSQTQAQAQGEWTTENFVPYIANISYQVTSTTSAILVLENDNPSGLPENQKKITIPLILIPSSISPSDSMDVKVYFMNNNLDKEISCNKVFPTVRQIDKTQAVASAAITELLKGPTEAEKAKGYSTTINPGVKIQKLTIVNGVAKIDFDETIENNVGGSCRVTAIRTEITETLKQFSSVKEVIISVNGRTDDILQP